MRLSASSFNRYSFQTWDPGGHSGPTSLAIASGNRIWQSYLAIVSGEPFRCRRRGEVPQGNRTDLIPGEQEESCPYDAHSGRRSPL